MGSVIPKHGRCSWVTGPWEVLMTGSPGRGRPVPPQEDEVRGRGPAHYRLAWGGWGGQTGSSRPKDLT